MKSLLFILFIACYSSYTKAFTYIHEMTEKQLQQQADTMMPLKRTKFFVTATLSEPIIDLREATNDISLTANVKAKTLGNLSGDGKVSFSGFLRYEKEQGSFYFDNLKMEHLEISNVPAELLPNIKAILEVAAQKVLSATPIYTFDKNNTQHQLAKSSLTSMQIENDTLLVTFDLF